MSQEENNNQESSSENDVSDSQPKDVSPPKEFNTDSLLNFSIGKAEKKKEKDQGGNGQGENDS